jgi:DNA-binding NarL/FixJ family response regulator
LEELRNLIVKLVIEDGVFDTPSDHLSPESLREAHQEIAQWGSAASPLEEWAAIQEVSQHLDKLAACAGLSPREAEVLALLRQGLTQEQIGLCLTPPQSRDTVKTWVERAREKMRQAREK